LVTFSKSCARKQKWMFFSEQCSIAPLWLPSWNQQEVISSPRVVRWHVIPEPRATLQGAVAWRIQCHDPCRATLKIVLHRIFCFPNAVWASVSGGFRIVSDTLVKTVTITFNICSQFRRWNHKWHVYSKFAQHWQYWQHSSATFVISCEIHTFI